MRFTDIDVNFDVRYKGHQNCPKILSMNILRVFSDHHLLRQNWRQYLWTSLCQFNFFVNLLHSLGVSFFDIWHFFDNLTFFWQLDIFLIFWEQITHGPHCPYPCTPLPMYPIAHMAHTPCTPYPLWALLPICPIPLYPIAHLTHCHVAHTHCTPYLLCPYCPYPCTPYPCGPHCPYAPYPLYPIAPCVPIVYVPHTPCTPLPLWASLVLYPTPLVPHFPMCLHCPCGPYPLCPHCPCAPCGLYPLYPIPPVHYCPMCLIVHVAHHCCPPLGNGLYW